MKQCVEVLVPMFAMSAILFAGCRSEPSEPVYDQEVGLTEAQVKIKYGAPFRMEYRRAQDMHDELRAAVLYNALAGKSDVEVKELVYGRGEGIAYYWLVQDEDGTWKVVADATVPPGYCY